MNKGKRLLLIPVVAVLTLVLLMSTAFADPPKTGCGTPGEAGHEDDEHDWEFVEVNTLKVVQVVWRCRRCGQEYWDVNADTMEEHKQKGNHLYLQGWSVTKRATCTEEGTESRTCVICNEKQTRAISKSAHKPVTVAGKAATCTENGLSDGTKCSACGTVIKAQETIPALGHDWKTETTAPKGLREGKKVTTCTRCGKSETTVIPVTGEFFAGLRKVQAATSELRITEELKCSNDSAGDGVLSRLTIGVEGGVPPYTYEWFRVGDSTETKNLVALKDALAEAGSKSGSLFRGIADITEATFKKQGITTYAKRAANPSSLPAEFRLGASKVGAGSEASYDVSEAGEYFCRVTDSLGKTVTSASVRSLIPLQIAEQPKSVNMRGKETALLQVAAKGGEPPYTYQWWYEVSGEKHELAGATSAALPIDRTQIGRVFYCVVTDREKKTVTSESASVFDAEYLTLYRGPDYVTLNEHKPTYELDFTVWDAGQPPYTFEMFWCDFDEFDAYADAHSYMEAMELLQSVYVSEPTNEKKFTYHVDKDGYFKCVVTDACGQTSEDAIGIPWVDISEFPITQQPSGGILADDGKFTLTIGFDISTAKSPVWIALYNENGRVGDFEYLDVSDTTYSKVVTEASCYWFEIEDIDGNYAYSEHASVTAYEAPVIESVPDQLILTDSPFAPAVIGVVVKGGEAPYHYDWRQYPADASSGTKPGKDPNRVIPAAGGLPDCNPLEVSVPGEFIVRVTDARGNQSAWSKVVKVVYYGSRPLISVQPADAAVTAFAGETARGMLRCEAITGGNDRLLYEWVKPNASGDGYVTVGTGQVYRTPAVLASTVQGPFYCCVTNLRTGEQTLSQGATVTIRFMRKSREGAIAELQEQLRSYEMMVEKLQLMLQSAKPVRARAIEAKIAEYKEYIAQLTAQIEELLKGGAQ